MAIVTDFKWKRKDGTIRIGYYMDRWLKENLDGIPFFIEKKYDVVGIISGTGRVRLGKSTLALQVGYYLAWVLAGGRTILSETGTLLEIIPPREKVKFDLNHIVFTPEDLKKKAHELPPNSVIVYDEGRAGLDASRSMESVNKGMQDFFQECGIFGHVILIVLPDFFQLHRSYAVNRSLFLLNVYANEQYDRGFFNFYNDTQKELLYFWGRKKVGAHFQYNAAKRNFWGRFSDWLPVDKDEYENAKKQALEAKRIGTKAIRELKERDLLIHYIIFRLGIGRSELVEDLETYGYKVDGTFFNAHTVQKALRNVERLWDGSEYSIAKEEEALREELEKELTAKIMEIRQQRKEARAKSKTAAEVDALIETQPREFFDNLMKGFIESTEVKKKSEEDTDEIELVDKNDEGEIVESDIKPESRNFRDYNNA